MTVAAACSGSICRSSRGEEASAIGASAETPGMATPGMAARDGDAGMELPAMVTSTTGDAGDGRRRRRAPAMPPAPPRPLRILVVDDLAMNREIMVDLLRADGHVVNEACDGNAAVDAAAANDFDIVLMDLCMPGLDGLEATRRVRALPSQAGARDDPRALGQRRSRAPARMPPGRHERAHRQTGQPRRAAGHASPRRPAPRRPVRRNVRGWCRPPRRLAPAAHAPILNADTLAEARVCMSAADFDRHLHQLAQRLVALGTVLERPEADWSLDALRDLTHDLASVGTLGFDALALAAARLEPILL